MSVRGQRTAPSVEAVIIKDGYAITYLSADTRWREADGAPASKREKFVHTWQSTMRGWKIIGGMCAPLEAYDAAVTASQSDEATSEISAAIADWAETYNRNEYPGKFLEMRRRQAGIARADLQTGGAPDGGDRDPDLTPILGNRTSVILEGIRSGDVSGIMPLYGDDSLYSPDSATLLSDRASIREFWINVAASPAHDAKLKVLKIERLSSDAFVEIQKYDVFDEAGERLFGGYGSLLWRRLGGRWIIAEDVSN